MNNYKYGCCPNCDSSRLKRQHRGVIRKYILQSPPIFICSHCEKSFSRNKIKYKEAFQENFNQATKPPSYT